MSKKDPPDVQLRKVFEKALLNTLRKQDPEIKKTQIELREASKTIRELCNENQDLKTEVSNYEFKRVKDVRADKDFLERVVEEIIFNHELPALEDLIEKKKLQWSAVVKNFS